MDRDLESILGLPAEDLLGFDNEPLRVRPPWWRWVAVVVVVAMVVATPFAFVLYHVLH